MLLTPTPDLNEDIKSDDMPLAAHATMIRQLAAEYNVGLIDTYGLFKSKAESGEAINIYMSQKNHPNALGHSCVANEILTWFIR